MNSSSTRFKRDGPAATNGRPPPGPIGVRALAARSTFSLGLIAMGACAPPPWRAVAGGWRPGNVVLV